MVDEEEDAWHDDTWILEAPPLPQQLNDLLEVPKCHPLGA
jgi:hypothetical protein